MFPLRITAPVEIKVPPTITLVRTVSISSFLFFVSCLQENEFRFHPCHGGALLSAHPSPSIEWKS